VGYEEGTSKNTEAWTVFCDGSWGTFGAGAAAVLVAPSKVKTCFVVKLDFSCTKNIAEYEALLLGLQKLRAMGTRSAILKTDSQVIAGHVDKSSKHKIRSLKNIWMQSEGWKLPSKVFPSKIFQEVKMSMQIC
jgi:ribonuclease HI